MRWFWQLLTPTEPREDWLVLDTCISFRERITSRLNVTHMDRVLRARLTFQEGR